MVMLILTFEAVVALKIALGGFTPQGLDQKAQVTVSASTPRHEPVAMDA